MGFRTVVVKSRVKLELRLNMLVIRGEVEKRVFLQEINTLIIQSTAVSVTAALLNELAKNNVKVIFCDEKCNPSAELLPYYGAHNTSKRYKQQIAWKPWVKGAVWRVLIRRKISEQANVLRFVGKPFEAQMLDAYVEEVEDGDMTNREGHAAKVYFNNLLREGESRRDDTFFNGCLNYGYAVLLSAFNREIVACGYMTQLGIWHNNAFNRFNLSSDFMFESFVVS
ncbi:MAG: type II CRISPR-associated endonuclease Cas1 [Clostridiales bacterium]|nr:type II CRISPR-associated endonuclease Cas1 [Clostridiales bacterium]